MAIAVHVKRSCSVWNIIAGIAVLRWLALWRAMNSGGRRAAGYRVAPMDNKASAWASPSHRASAAADRRALSGGVAIKKRLSPASARPSRRQISDVGERGWVRFGV